MTVDDVLDASRGFLAAIHTGNPSFDHGDGFAEGLAVDFLKQFRLIDPRGDVIVEENGGKVLRAKLHAQADCRVLTIEREVFAIAEHALDGIDLVIVEVVEDALDSAAYVVALIEVVNIDLPNRDKLKVIGMSFDFVH